jgi:hypothetical protein
MTPGDLVITVEFTTEADEKTAYLGSLYAGSGVISPDFARDNYDYTIAVPFGTEEFSISAQAENPYLEPELRQLSPESGDKELDDELTLTEGLNEYTITVTSQDGSATKEYRIKAVKLPDLSLADFKITAGMDFEQYLPPFDTQSVYVPYANGITVVAAANGAGAAVNSPVSANNLKVNEPTAVTVTVSKTLSGVDTSLTAKNYILNLYYGEGMPPDPLSEGGYVSFVPGNNGANSYDEVHTFLADTAAAGGQAAYSLVFKDSTYPLTVEVLVVAGGGGGGSTNGATSSGGGAGRFVYHPAFNVSGNGAWDSAGTISVKVGAGGSGGGSGGGQGGNGGVSEFVRHSGYKIITPGGGGGAGNGGTARPGNNGGSGGGSHYNYPTNAAPGSYRTTASAGTAPNEDGVLNLGNGGHSYRGGGAGEASGGGEGIGAQSAISGESKWYAGGGSTGGSEKYGAGLFANGDSGTGDGGGGGNGGGNPRAGGKGGSGIVIVRFPHPGNQSETE